MVVSKQRHTFQQRTAGGQQDAIPPTFQLQTFLPSRFAKGLPLLCALMPALSRRRRETLHPRRRRDL
jgi:hypothetical protein